jgi:uncharacterized protein YbgA (DUF1722 family)
MLMWKACYTYTVGNSKVFVILKEAVPQELTALGLTKEIQLALQKRRNRNNVFLHRTGPLKKNLSSSAIKILFQICECRSGTNTPIVNPLRMTN